MGLQCSLFNTDHCHTSLCVYVCQCARVFVRFILWRVFKNSVAAIVLNSFVSSEFQQFNLIEALHTIRPSEFNVYLCSQCIDSFM